MRRTILLVGDDPTLLATRAQILNDWEIRTTETISAPEAIRKGAFDLLIVCQSVPDSMAKTLISEAARLNSDLKVLALCYDGEERPLDAVTLHSDIYRPARLREVVAKLISANDPLSP